jgi:hypothetical protein
MAYLSGANNDAMVNRLVSQGFIRSAEVEQAFRVVDRGEFVPDDKRPQAYNDTALTSDKNIHISGMMCFVLSVCLSVCVCLSICLSVCLSVVCVCPHHDY